MRIDQMRMSSKFKGREKARKPYISKYMKIIEECGNKALEWVDKGKENVI